MKSGGLFAGYGGLDMAVAEVFGAEPAWFSEIDDWDTVEPVDILSGGFPCQDVSAAGKRAGLHPDTRSGLWNHMAYAISKLRPRYVVAENVRGLLSAEAHSDVEPCPWCLGDGPGEPALRALGAVLGDLAELGYDARWCGLRAADVGAPHGRFRIFVLARDTACVGGGSPWPGNGEPPRADGSGGAGELTAADTSSIGHQWGGAARLGRSGSTDGGTATAYSDNGGRHGGEREQVRGSSRRAPASGGGPALAWAEYGPAIEQWERILGRVAPAPTELATKGGQRLSPQFVEWMMGLPAGHVTDVPGVNRNAQLKALGNGVVPQQAIAALRHMTSLIEVAA